MFVFISASNFDFPPSSRSLTTPITTMSKRHKQTNDSSPLLELVEGTLISSQHSDFNESPSTPTSENELKLNVQINSNHDQTQLDDENESGSEFVDENNLNESSPDHESELSSQSEDDENPQLSDHHIHSNTNEQKFITDVKVPESKESDVPLKQIPMKLQPSMHIRTTKESKEVKENDKTVKEKMIKQLQQADETVKLYSLSIVNALKLPNL